MARFALLAAASVGVLAQGVAASGLPHRPGPPGGNLQSELVVSTLPATVGRGNTVLAPKEASSVKDCGAVQRSTRDRPDLRAGRLVHVIYLLPADGTDHAIDADGTLECSVRAQNDWFEEASGGLRWRFDTFKAPGPKGKRVELTDVTFVHSEQPGSSLGDGNSVATELRNLGFSDPEKRYLSFVDAESTACGDAAYPISFGPGAWRDGQYSQVYLGAPDGCRADEFGTPGNAAFAEAIAQQELIHNDGLTSPGAPHGCVGGVPPGIGHVCTGPLFLTEGNAAADPERTDVMFPYVSVPLSKKVLDIGSDDYFRHPFPHLFDLQDSPYLARD